jgi:acyl transferase domain-containing protein/NADPH:quinone reductase-like Zn-dependent oxidoreductase/acyl carrier protein
MAPGDSCNDHSFCAPQQASGGAGSPSAKTGDIAIVGVSCRLPGDINCLADLWEILRSGRNAVSEASLSRWDSDTLIANLGANGKALDGIRYGCFLSDEVIEGFRASLFGISDAEAQHMDPAQRLLLEASYDAFVDAGYTKDTLKGSRTGVFVAASGVLGEEGVANPAAELSVYDATGRTLSVASGRISYCLGLQGPCATVDTACSSSLVALHYARSSLLNGECGAAVVSAVNVLTSSASIACAVAGMTSADGKCHTFDSEARGYGRGEGCGAIVLKRMEDAVRDGDSIYAVVKGSAVMQDGKSASLTAPNGVAQELLLRAALDDAGVHPAQVVLVEAHGTGTKLGDPVETEAIAAVYGKRASEAPLQVTGVKANISHLEAAAGMAGLLASIAALRAAQAPPNALLRTLNPKITDSVGSCPIEFPTSCTHLRRVEDKPLVAAVSSFGYSGTIAHVVLANAPGQSVRTICGTAAQQLRGFSSRYPLTLQNHRMLQYMQAEAYSGKTIFAAHLHGGIQKTWLSDYRVEGAAACPTSVLLELASASVFRQQALWASPTALVANISSAVVEVLKFSAPHVMRAEPASDGTPVKIIGILGDSGALEICNDIASETCRVHARAEVALLHGEEKSCAAAFLAALQLGKVDARVLPTAFELDDAFYEGLAKQGLHYGTAFRSLRCCWVGNERSRCEIALEGMRSMQRSYLLPPPLMEAVAAAAMVLLRGSEDDALVHALVMVGVDRLLLDASQLTTLWEHSTCHCEVLLVRKSELYAVVDATLFTGRGDAAVHLKGLRLQCLRDTPLVAGRIAVPSPAYDQLTPHWVPTVSGAVTRSAAYRGVVVGWNGVVDHAADIVREIAEAGAAVRLATVDEFHHHDPTHDDFAVCVVAAPVAPLGDAISTVLGVIGRAAGSAKRVVVVPVQHVICEATLEAFAAAVTGACLTAQLEYPGVDFTVLSALDAMPKSSLSQIVLDELHHSNADIDVQYSGSQRFVKRYRPLQQPRMESEPITLNSVIVTGGLGGLGLQTAKVLAQQGAKHIFLVSRSGKVSHESQGLKEDLRWLQEESGAQVHILQCDVSDETAVMAMLGSVRHLAGAVSGIVHCAGILQDGFLRGGKAAAGCAAVWNAKALSAWWLHKHTASDGLQCFVVYSSVTAAIGSVGQSAYGAANSFLDALVSERRRQGLPGVSIQWPAVSGVGMAAATWNMDTAADHSSWSVTSSDLRDVLTGVLSAGGQTSVLVFPKGLTDPLGRQVRQLFPSTSSSGSSVPAAMSRPKVKPVSQFTETDVRAGVFEIVTSLMNGQSVPADAQLMEFGLDSLAASELPILLSRRFHIRVMPTLAFNHPTVDAIIQHVCVLVGLQDSASDAAELSSRSRDAALCDVAIVGVGCRLPGDVNSLSRMWEMLRDKEDKTSEVSFDRWDADALAYALSPEEKGASLAHIRYGGFLSNEVLEGFRASVFGISDAEAQHMDPAQRLLLEATYDAFVDAGYTKDTLKGSHTGVFVAASGVLGEEGVQQPLVSPSVFDATGRTLSVASGRISYSLGLQGPCTTIDTACSSSLVALHQARRSLQLGECAAAVVASCNVLTAAASVACAVAGMTSPDGKCHTFDEAANGYCRGEGCGAVVLKRLGDAVRDGDRVYAVLKGSAVMQDGRSASLTAPNGHAQELLMRAALADAGLKPAQVHHLEAHGTGTKLGDPVETQAICNVYSAGRPGSDPLHVSGVKANVGHLEAAAGMAGLLSAILAIQHRAWPPNAQLRTLNAGIAATVAGHPIEFPTETASALGSELFTSAVSSFGYSGTIAHVILQAPPQSIARRFDDATPEHHVEGSAVPTAWMFAGQGTLKVNSGKALYENGGAFRATMDRCDAILLSEIGVTAASLLYPAEGGQLEAAEAQLVQTLYAQPVLVAFEFSLAAEREALATRPDIVLGHSLGEYAAAVVAGVMSLEDCLRLVCRRAELTDRHPGCRGRMVAVRAPAAAVQREIAACGLADSVTVAAVNGAESTVISGPVEAVKAVLDRTNWSRRTLSVENAFHSPNMEAIEAEFRTVLGTVQLGKPSRCAFVSTVTGCAVGDEITTAQYWIDHLLQPVNFHGGVNACLAEGVRRFVEIGSDSTLQNLTRSIIHGMADEIAAATVVSGLSTSDGDAHDALKVRAVPRYPLRSVRSHAMLQSVEREAFTGQTVFKAQFHDGIISNWLRDHVVHGDIICPGAALLEVAFAAAAYLRNYSTSSMSAGEECIRVSGFSITKPVVVGSEHERAALVCVAGDDGAVELYTDLSGEDYELHAQGHFEFVARPASFWVDVESQTDSSLQACNTVVGGDDVYSTFATCGLDYGASFRLIENCKSGARVCVATLRMSAKYFQQRYLLPPPLLDAVLQASAVLVSRYCAEHGVALKAAHVPYAVDDVFLRASKIDELWESETCSCTVTMRSVDADMTVFDCALLTAKGSAVMSMVGVYARALSPVAQTHDAIYRELGCHAYSSNWQPASTAAVNRVAPDGGAVLVITDSVDGADIAEKLRASLPGRAVEWHQLSEDLTLQPDVKPYSTRVVCNWSGKHTMTQLLHLLERLCDGAGRVLYVQVEPEAAARSRVDNAGSLLCAQAEYPHVMLTHMTVDSGSAAAVADAVIRQLTCRTAEVELQYKGGELSCRRYHDARIPQGPQEIHMRDRGSLDNLELRDASADVGDLSDEYCEVQICAVALNFRDVLNVLGMYPGDPGMPGCEYAGTVTRVGRGVTRLQVGDTVVGISSGCLRQTIREHHLMMCRKPALLTMSEASAIPVVFCTVHLALAELAGLQAGQTILIHAAAGGIGLAAIQYAQRVGARVVATASEGKHEYLRSLGVELLSTSRDAERFFADVSQMGLQGSVDVVLNSLSDKYIDYSLQLLRQGGTFVEIGKRGIWSSEQVHSLRSDVCYHVLALDTMSVVESARFSGLLERVCLDFESRLWSAPLLREYDFYTQYRDAFECLKNGSSVGKVVLKVSPQSRGLDSVVVTGVMGGLGLQTAKVLAQQGAKHIFLVSRSGKVSHEGQGLEEDLRWLQEESGAVVHILRCDVSDETQVVTMLQTVRTTAGGVSGVVHCAGVLRDGLIRNGAAAIGGDDVWHSKAHSAWLLHCHTQADNLTLFVVYSSTTAVLGTPGQSAYGAANRSLDDLVLLRSRSGQPALSIHWPAITGKGMAAATFHLSKDTAISQWTMSEQQFASSLRMVLSSPVPVGPGPRPAASSHD